MGVANNSQRGTSERVREKMLFKSGIDTQGLIELATICKTLIWSNHAQCMYMYNVHTVVFEVTK